MTAVAGLPGGQRRGLRWLKMAEAANCGVLTCREWRYGTDRGGWRMPGQVAEALVRLGLAQRSPTANRTVPTANRIVRLTEAGRAVLREARQ